MKAIQLLSFVGGLLFGSGLLLFSASQVIPGIVAVVIGVVLFFKTVFTARK